MLIVEKYKAEIIILMKLSRKSFAMKDLGVVKRIPGMKITRNHSRRM